MDDYKIVNAKGFKWAVRPSSKIGNCTQDMLGPNEREDYNFNALVEYSDQSKCFIDIGANVGGFTLPASRLYKSVWAFEPQHFNFEALEENVRLNNLSNVNAVNVGIGEDYSVKEISARGGGSMIYHEELNKMKDFVYNEVKILPLDSIQFDCPVAVIKIDTEGYEEQVLLGAKETIDFYRPVLIIETHEKTYHGLPLIKGQIDRIKNMLKDRDYSCKVLFKTTFGDEHLIFTPNA